MRESHTGCVRLGRAVFGNFVHPIQEKDEKMYYKALELLSPDL